MRLRQSLASAVVGTGLAILVSGSVLAAQGDGIGGVLTVHRSAYGQVPGAERRDLFPEFEVFANERVETVLGGGLAVRFLDGTQITLGSDSDLVLDAFVYDPGGGGAGEAVVRLGTGAFRFVSSQLARDSGTRFETPAATIGIRGTDFVVVVTSDGTTKVGTITGEVAVRANRSGQQARIDPGFFAIVSAAGNPFQVERAPISPSRPSDLALWLSGDPFLAGTAGLGPVYDDENEREARIEVAPPPAAPPPVVVVEGPPPGSAPPAPDPPPAALPPESDPPPPPPSEPPPRGDHDRGHGNEADGIDEDNPGQSGARLAALGGGGRIEDGAARGDDDRSAGGGTPGGSAGAARETRSAPDAGRAGSATGGQGPSAAGPASAAGAATVARGRPDEAAPPSGQGRGRDRADHPGRGNGLGNRNGAGDNGRGRGSDDR